MLDEITVSEQVQHDANGNNDYGEKKPYFFPSSQIANADQLLISDKVPASKAYVMPSFEYRYCRIATLRRYEAGLNVY